MVMIRDRITWGAGNPLSDPRLKDLDKYVNDIWANKANPNVKKGGQDGVFKNKEGYLPEKPEGYYREYYVTPKTEAEGWGMLRLVLGREGEVYITGDHYGKEGAGFRQIVGMPIEALEKRRAERLSRFNTALFKLNDFRLRLENLVSLYESEHQAQLDLKNNSFAGYWVNELFNRPAPDTLIWANAHSRLYAAQRELRSRNLVRAYKELVRARIEYIKALKKYMSWKSGIEAACTCAYVAIGVTAVAVIGLAVVGAVAAPAGAETGVLFTGAAEGAGGTAAVQATMTRIAVTLARADATIAAADAASEQAAALAEAELETEMELLERTAIVP